MTNAAPPPMHPDDVRAWRRQHVPVFNENRLKLGIFGMNCSNGCTITHAETSFVATYEHNVKIAKLADELGFEMLVPVGRWKHFGGTTKFNSNNMEVFTWATAMACNTSRIMPFATSHVPTVHPLFAAKQASTIDNISAGRFGLNIVCGWFRPEIEMFGMEQLPHESRYGMAQEWLEVIRKAWREQDFDYQGQHYQIKGGYLDPKPVQQPHPVLINAGNSEEGRDFSARNVDFNFITMATKDQAVGMVEGFAVDAHGGLRARVRCDELRADLLPRYRGRSPGALPAHCGRRRLGGGEEHHGRARDGKQFLQRADQELR